MDAIKAADKKLVSPSFEYFCLLFFFSFFFHVRNTFTLFDLLQLESSGLYFYNYIFFFFLLTSHPALDRLIAISYISAMVYYIYWIMYMDVD